MVSKQDLRKFLKRYAKQRTIERKQGSDCPSKTTLAIQIITRQDDVTTATQKQGHMVFMFILILHIDML